MPLHRPIAVGGHVCPGEAMPRDAARPTADLQLQLPCDDDAPGSVRDVLRGLHGVGWLIGDAMLVASELVTNAVIHSGAGPEDLLAVHVKLGDGRLLISVRDPGISGRIAKPRPNDDEYGGLGLRLVAQLSRRWGTERRRGQRVWAELAVPDQEPTPQDGAHPGAPLADASS
jgi:anti-sigma regulatory factor (Ser/Thr protein kinase)